MIRLATDSNWKGSTIVGDVVWGEYNKEIIKKDSSMPEKRDRCVKYVFCIAFCWGKC